MDRLDGVFIHLQPQLGLRRCEMFVYMPHDKHPLFDPYIHKDESEY